jgi:hypothetical protein
VPDGVVDPHGKGGPVADRASPVDFCRSRAICENSINVLKTMIYEIKDDSSGSVAGLELSFMAESLAAT